jgi:hypothetical protein
MIPAILSVPPHYATTSSIHILYNLLFTCHYAILAMYQSVVTAPLNKPQIIAGRSDSLEGNSRCWAEWLADS